MPIRMGFSAIVERVTREAGCVEGSYRRLQFCDIFWIISVDFSACLFI